MSKTLFFALIVIVAMASTAAAGPIAITEWMYSQVAGPGEYFEITNISGVPVSMTGWSEDDNNRNPGVHPLGAFGTLQPGESATRN